MKFKSLVFIFMAMLIVLTNAACSKKAENSDEKKGDNAEIISNSDENVPEKQGVESRKIEKLDKEQAFEICETGNCKCGNGACAKDAVCIRDNCYCFDRHFLESSRVTGSEEQNWAINFLKGNDAGEFTCKNSSIEKGNQSGDFTLISHYICENPDGCTTTVSKEKFAYKTCLTGGDLLDKDTEPYGMALFSPFFSDCLDLDAAEAGRSSKSASGIQLTAAFEENELLEMCGKHEDYDNLKLDTEKLNQIKKAKKGAHVLFAPETSLSYLCKIRQVCRLSAVPADARDKYVCEIGADYIEGMKGEARLIPEPVGLRCAAEGGCACGDKNCEAGKYCSSEGECRDGRD